MDIKPKYAISCIVCGAQENLAMVAHRNNSKNMVGWIFVCQDCFSVVSNKNIKFNFEEL